MPVRVGSKPVAPIVLLMLLIGLVNAGCNSSNQPESAAAKKPKKHLALNLARPDRLATVVATRGPNDPHEFDLSLLVPTGSRLRQIWFIHGGHAADQVLVEWIRSKSVSLYGEKFSDTVRWGLTLWTQTPRGPADSQAPWKGVAIPMRDAAAWKSRTTRA